MNHPKTNYLIYVHFKISRRVHQRLLVPPWYTQACEPDNRVTEKITQPTKEGITNRLKLFQRTCHIRTCSTVTSHNPTGCSFSEMSVACTKAKVLGCLFFQETWSISRNIFPLHSIQQNSINLNARGQIINYSRLWNFVVFPYFDWETDRNNTGLVRSTAGRQN